MGFRIAIAGESQCELFAQSCLVADYLAENLPEFCYERTEKNVLEWKQWLAKINLKNKWHHSSSPLVWKELLVKGSKAYYIGGASEFWDYCHSYYNFECFLSKHSYQGLVKNMAQFANKIKYETNLIQKIENELIDTSPKEFEDKNIVVTISGAGNPLTMFLISSMLDITVDQKQISKLLIHEKECSQAFMEYIELECSFVHTNSPNKVVKFVEKLGTALNNSDLFIVMDHVAFDEEAPIGDWLHANKSLMQTIAEVINVSAANNLRIVLPNLGPACYNATVLSENIISNCKHNIVVASSDLGLEVASVAAEIAEVPLRNIFCPPVWGFVGVNHLVDINTTIHRYDSFEPYTRYTKVKNSTLTVGSLTPELRTMEYLMYRHNDKLWSMVAERKKKIPENQMPLNKAEAVVNIVKMWLFDRNPENIVSLGIFCTGAFGLNFKGWFSQPARLVDDKWKPAENYWLPRDRQMKLPYMVQMAEIVMNLPKKALPKIVPHFPCYCKPKLLRKKEVWF